MNDAERFLLTLVRTANRVGVDLSPNPKAANYAPRIARIVNQILCEIDPSKVAPGYSPEALTRSVLDAAQRAGVELTTVRQSPAYGPRLALLVIGMTDELSATAELLE